MSAISAILGPKEVSGLFETVTTNLRLPEQLHARLAWWIDQQKPVRGQGYSANTVIVAALTEHLNREEAPAFSEIPPAFVENLRQERAEKAARRTRK